MARKFEIRRSMHKDMIYGSLMELVKNGRVWHESTVSPEYSHLTEDGKKAIIHVVEDMFRGMQTIHNQEVKEEAKRQTLEGLKG
jgi:acid stress-induced BolA-like protein IbaG/YrbA